MKSKNQLCPIAQNQLYLHSSGKVYPCGFLQGTYEIGDVKKDSLVKIWDSAIAKKFRADNFQKCSNLCSEMQAKYNCHLLHPSMESVNQENKVRRLDIMIDSFCNLKCVMCTNRSEVNKGFVDDKFWQELESFILKDVLEIELVGGEPFVSKDTYRLIELVKKVNPSIRWCFTTNGHFDFDNLLRKHLKDLKIYSFAVSIDSFKEDKFKEIRVGGDLEKTLQTLNKINEERLRHNLSFHLTINFLIQKANYDEIELALIKANELKLPIYFILLRDPSEFSILELDNEKLVSICKNYLFLAQKYSSIKLLNLAIKIIKELDPISKIQLMEEVLRTKTALGEYEEV